MPTTTKAWRPTGKRRRQAELGPGLRGEAAGEISARVEAAIGHLVAEILPHLWNDLTEVGKALLARELAEAYMSAPVEDRALAAQNVLEAWNRTWTLRHTPGFAEAMARGERAEARAEPAYTIDELDKLIGL
jgi:hypothetical protein